MSPSHDSIKTVSSAHSCKPLKQDSGQSYNLSDLLATPEPNKIIPTSLNPPSGLGSLAKDHLKVASSHNLGSDGTLGQSSLAQVMAQHEQKCTNIPPLVASTGVSLDYSAPLTTSPFGSFLGATAPLSAVLSQGPSVPPSPGLSVGSGVTLSSGFSLGTSVPAGLGVTSSSALLTCSLSSLALQDSQRSPLPPVSLGGLRSVLQSSGPLGVPGQGKSSGSLSLAELIQEHQDSSPKLYDKIPGLQNSNSGTQNNTHIQKPIQTSAPPGFSEAPSLSELMSRHQTSLACTASRKSENCSNHQASNKSATALPKPPSLSLNRSVDLSALMSQTSPDSRSPTLLSFTCVSASEKKRMFAKPSIFALALCVHVRSVRSRRSRATRNAFLYSRQMERVKERVQCLPLHHIAPFSFDTPSPDDIVKANQRKAFTRD